MKAFLISIFGKSSGLAAAWQSHAGLAELQPAEGMGSEGRGCLENFPETSPKIPWASLPKCTRWYQKPPIPQRALIVLHKSRSGYNPRMLLVPPALLFPGSRGSWRALPALGCAGTLLWQHLSCPSQGHRALWAQRPLQWHLKCLDTGRELLQGCTWSPGRARSFPNSHVPPCAEHSKWHKSGGKGLFCVLFIEDQMFGSKAGKLAFLSLIILFSDDDKTLLCTKSHPTALPSHETPALNHHWSCLKPQQSEPV